MRTVRAAEAAWGQIRWLPSRWVSAVTDWGVRALTDPVKLYDPVQVTDLRALKQRLRAGDVVLVCGNSRISSVVKVLTLSSWSHIVLYVGARTDLLSEAECREWSERLGPAALQHLVVDADPVHRVHLRPLDDYAGLMLRHCRADGLHDDDVPLVIDRALAQLGREYDVRHILRLLAFYAFPWGYLPERLRRVVTEFTLSDSERICSRVVSEAFTSVGYPIRGLALVRSRGTLPGRALGFARGLRRRSRTAARLLVGGRVRSALSRLTDQRYTELHLSAEHHITPADYDLSRFFSIMKDPDDLAVDYRSATAIPRTADRSSPPY